MNKKRLVKIVDGKEKKMAAKVESPNGRRMVSVVGEPPSVAVNNDIHSMSGCESGMSMPTPILMCKVIDDEKRRREENSKPEDRFSECTEGLYKDGVYIMNATVEILDIETGSEVEKVHCKVYVFGSRSFEKRLSVREFRDGRWLWDYAAIAFKCEKKRAQDAVYQYMNFLLERADIKICSFREHQGWTKVEGKPCYVTKSGIIGGSDIVKAKKGTDWCPMLPMSCAESCYDFTLQMRNLTNSNPTATALLLYLLQSSMYTLYKEAKVVPKYCLFVEGPKGSHKTSLAIALMNFNGDGIPRFTFKDTTAGLEAGFAENADAVMIVDDLMPTDDFAVRRNIERNLEILIRLFGDANGKNRNLDFCDGKGPKYQYTTHGGIVFTGEYVNSMCASSLTRMVVLHIDDQTVDTDFLTLCQNNSQELSSFLQHFIMFVMTNYDKCIKLIGNIVRDTRNKLQNEYSSPRYAEYIAQLKAAATILGLYGIAINCLKEEDLDSFVEEMMVSVKAVIRSNDTELKDEEPARRIVLAILEGMRSGTLKMLKENERAVDDACVVIDNDFIYITEKGLVQCYREYLYTHGYPRLDCKDSSLKTWLVDAGILQIQQEGKKKRYAAKISGQGNKRFLHLHKTEVYKTAGEEMEGLG